MPIHSDVAGAAKAAAHHIIPGSTKINKQGAAKYIDDYMGSVEHMLGHKTPLAASRFSRNPSHGPRSAANPKTPLPAEPNLGSNTPLHHQAAAAAPGMVGGGGGTSAFAFLGDMHPLGSALAMGAVGGITSYATGGNILQGATLGAGLGFGGVMGLKYGAEYASENLGQGMMKDAAMSTRAFFAGGGPNAGRASATGNTRAAMLAGAGLGGLIFGGRRNHRRGFNSRRGNSF